MKLANKAVVSEIRDIRRVLDEKRSQYNEKTGNDARKQTWEEAVAIAGRQERTTSEFRLKVRRAPAR